MCQGPLGRALLLDSPSLQDLLGPFAVLYQITDVHGANGIRDGEIFLGLLVYEKILQVTFDAPVCSFKFGNTASTAASSKGRIVGGPDKQTARARGLNT